MKVVTLCPMRASSFVWQARSGAPALTLMVKATFAVELGECPPAPEQEGDRKCKRSRKCQALSAPAPS